MIGRVIGKTVLPKWLRRSSRILSKLTFSLSAPLAAERTTVEEMISLEAEIPEVLLLGDEGGPRIGTPLVEGAKVVGTITAQDRGPKLVIFKMKRRKGYRRKTGHRQGYTELRVDRIEG